MMLEISGQGGAILWHIIAALLPLTVKEMEALGGQGSMYSDMA
jgi:hypothetical protein